MTPKIIVIHHSASSKDTTLKQIDAWHKQRDFPLSSLGYYVGYHYVIAWDGTVTQTRKDDEIGAHSPPNDDRLGICLIGNFNEYSPSFSQISSMLKLLARLEFQYPIESVKAHRELNSTECPGNHLATYLYLIKDPWYIMLYKAFKKLLSVFYGYRSSR